MVKTDKYCVFHIVLKCGFADNYHIQYDVYEINL